MFRLIKAFIKKVFLSMSHCLHTTDADHFVYFLLKEKTFLIKTFIVFVFFVIERKTFLIKALISQNVEQDVMNTL